MPKEHQVLVRVHAASANALDWRRFGGNPLIVRLMGGGMLKPRETTLGVDIAGRVEAVGSSVTEFQPGDEVFGLAPGSFAEYACAGKSKLVLKPAHLSFEAAAAVPVAALTALQGLRDKGRIQPGQKVLIYGAGGGVGTFAVQMAKAFGAEVTAVCGTHNVEMVRSIGADHVIDYTREDFAKTGQRYDLILAVNGYNPMMKYWRALGPNGTYIAAGGTMAQFVQALLVGPLVSKIGSKKMGSMGISTPNQADLVLIKELLEAGKVVPVIDRCYPLRDAVEAMQYIARGHARGKVVITVGAES